MQSGLFKIITTPSEELISLLSSNVIGTPGKGMLYQHLEVRDKIYRIKDPFFVNLIRNQKLIGSCCFCHRGTHNDGIAEEAFYLRYFSFEERYRSAPSTEKNRSGNSSLRKEIRSILSGNGLGKSPSEKFYHYAYVDLKNIRSLRLCKEFGFEHVRKFSTLIFNRLHPEPDKRVSIITSEEAPEVAELVKQFYKDYSMFSLENLFDGRAYYVVKDKNGNIIAGTQVNPDHWKIHSMPGIVGKVILPVFSSLPYLKRLINKDYRFLTFEGIFHKPGHKKDLESLFESLLHLYGRNIGMAWADSNSALFKALSSLDLGLLNKMNGNRSAEVIVRFVNLSKAEKNTFSAKPAYISGIDLT